MHESAGQDAGRQVGVWAREALTTLAALPGVRRVGLALREGGGRRLRFTASDRHPGTGVEWCHVDAYDDVPLNAAIRTEQPVIGALADLDDRFEEFVERQQHTSTAAVAAVPIVADEQILGGFVVFFDRTQSFDPTQRRELCEAGADLGARLRRAQQAPQRPDVTLIDEPAPSGATVATHEVPSDTAAVGRARRFLRTTLLGWGVEEETTDRAVLCLSEVVTNAVIHAHSGCAVRVVLDHGTLTVTVRDHGTADRPEAESSDDPLRVHGHGLQLIEALTTRWAAERDRLGTSVWFELEA